jgi:mutator protein MutT
VLAAVITEGGRYLVGQRPSHKRHGGLWEFPGGKIESGESDLDAARRELREELGVEVETILPALFVSRDGNSDFMIEFVPTVIAGQPQPIEHSALTWATEIELTTMDLAPSDRRFVEFLQGSHRGVTAAGEHKGRA